MPEEPNIPDTFTAYEEGKYRRYSLLFAVNGGAFAVAKLFADPPEQSAVLGDLRLWQLSLGMVLFTIVMVSDSIMFGQNMHKKLPELFRWQGKLVVTLIGLLISAGWTLVSFGFLGLALVILGYLRSIAAVSLLTKPLDTEAELQERIHG
jgi:hypothetical protein